MSSPPDESPRGISPPPPSDAPDGAAVIMRTPRPSPPRPSSDVSMIRETLAIPVSTIAKTLAFSVPAVPGKGLKEAATSTVAALPARPDLFFVLFQLGKALAESTGLEGMLRTSMSFAFDSTKASRGVVFVLDPAGEPVPAFGWDRRSGKVPGAGLKVSRGVVRRVLADEVSVIASDAISDPRFTGQASIALHHIRSILCVPLWDAGRTCGAIYLDNPAAPSAFEKDDLDLLTAVGNLVATRIRQDELESRLRREEVLRANLARYHSPDVVEMLVTRGAEVGLEMVLREVTVLFVDVAGSTRLAERLGPAGTAAILNSFLGSAADAVFRHGGSVNKFIGDEVMALYNAPLDVPDHAAAAVRTGLDVLAAVRERNAAARDADHRISVHVGVNTGRVMAGNIGTPARMEYTVLGDPVNVAARLCKVLPVDRIAVGARTAELARGRPGCRFEDLGEVQLRGRERSIRCFEASAE